MLQNKKLLIVSLANGLLIAAYVFFAYIPVGQHLAASLLELVATPTQSRDLTFVQADNFGSLDPHEFAATDQVALGLIYEPLVRFDQFLNIEPALAYAWYFRDTQNFVAQLRSDALFHDDTTVSCDSVAASLERAQNHANSSLRDLFAGVSLTAESERVCVFHLPAPDHNFLRKLTRLLILPAELARGSTDSTPTQVIGTGRYRLLDREKNTLSFAAFEHYYFYDSLLPDSLTLLAESKKYNRLALLKNKQADVLLDVPASFAQQIESRYGYTVTPVPSYESLFLLFNFQSKELKKDDSRKNLASQIHSMGLAGLIQDQSLYDLSQFAPSGVFGFAPELLDVQWPEPVTPADKIFLALGVTAENKKVAQILQTELAKKNIDLTLRELSADDLLAELRTGRLDLYLLGWRYELGSIDDFLAKLVRSDSPLTGYGYDSSETDAAIDSALADTDTDSRLGKWQKVMARLVAEDVIGAPLLGTKRLYAVRDDLTIFHPRTDGLIIFDNF